MVAAKHVLQYLIATSNTSTIMYISYGTQLNAFIHRSWGSSTEHKQRSWKGTLIKFQTRLHKPLITLNMHFFSSGWSWIRDFIECSTDTFVARTIEDGISPRTITHYILPKQHGCYIVNQWRYRQTFLRRKHSDIRRNYFARMIEKREIVLDHIPLRQWLLIF